MIRASVVVAMLALAACQGAGEEPGAVAGERGRMGAATPADAQSDAQLDAQIGAQSDAQSDAQIGAQIGAQSDAQPDPFPAHAPGEAPPGMVWIPGGRFTMGHDGEFSEPAERPEHLVYVDGFFMDAHPVTNAEFAEFVAATGYVTIAERAPDLDELMRQLPPGTPPPAPELLVPGSLVFTPTSRAVDLRDWSQWWRWQPGADWRHPDGPGSSIDGRVEHPAVHVAWDDAVAYAEWAGRRLPTEAEWEFAARAGRDAVHVWGNARYDPAAPQAHIYDGAFPTHHATTTPVGSFAPNPYGLHDMAGNVWEWTLDWYRPDAYALDAARGLARNPTGPAAGLGPSTGDVPAKVLRGGSFLCNDSYCRGYRVSARSPGAPDSGASNIGFRTIMTVEQWQRWRDTNALPFTHTGEGPR